jgi:hypothetical protein
MPITRNAAVLFTLLLAAAGTGRAQVMPDLAKQHDQMRKVSFLAGRWEGEGWAQMGPGGREEFLQTEEVVWKLDSLVVQIDGLGRKKSPDGSAGAVSHQALGVLSYDEPGARYRFLAYTAEGRVADATATVAERSLVWSFGVPGGIQIRYTIMIDEKDQWQEIGEFSPDRENWTQFLQMTLRRKP